jgi:hypothetical protein
MAALVLIGGHNVTLKQIDIPSAGQHGNRRPPFAVRSEDHMNPRTTFVLAGVNLAKSKFSPGPPPKNLSHNLQGEGEYRKVTTTSVDARGNPGGIAGRSYL